MLKHILLHIAAWILSSQCHGLEHLAYFPATDLPAHIERVQILDPNAWHAANIDKAFASIDPACTHLQADIEVKGEPFKEAFPTYDRTKDLRSNVTFDIIRQLGCEANYEIWRRAPEATAHVWINGNQQKTPGAIKRLNNLWAPDGKTRGLAITRVVADVEHFYNGKNLAAWEADQYASQVPAIYRGRCCLAVNLNNHFGDGQAFGVDFLETAIKYAEANGFDYIGWHVFNNAAMGYGSFTGPELANWREAIQ